MAAEDVEKKLKSLPVDDLNQMVIFLQEIISQLLAKQKELDELEKTLKDSQEEDLEETLKEIQVIRIRIIFLIEQSKIGLDRIMSAQGTRDKQGQEIQRFTIMLTELESWLEATRNLRNQYATPNNEQEVVFLIQAFENRLKELRSKSQSLDPLKQKLEEFERDPDLSGISSSLAPRLDSLRREFSQLDQLLRDQIDSLQEIHVVFINRGRTPEDQPVVKPVAATPHDQESKPTRIFVPKARKGDPLSKPDGSLTNVCRTEEAFTTFLPPQSTESTFKPISMSESRKPKHKKPPTITTDSFEDSSGSLPDEYSAEQVSQKVFDFLEIDQPDRDDTIDSRASPIPCDRIIDRDSPRFEYYEEIEFKKPVRFGQTRQIEKHELYETDDLPEAEPEYKEYLDGKKMIIEEVEQPGRTRTHRYLIKGVDPKQVKEYKYVRLPTESKEPLDDGTFDQPTTVRIREGTRTVVRTIRRRIIRKVVIINGVETVTEEVVEEPVEETVSEFDQPEIEEIEDDVTRQGKEPKRLEYVKVDKKPESVTPEDELERRIRTSILRPDAKEFTPGSSFTPSSGTPSQKTTFVVRETVQPVAQTPKTQELKREDAPTDRVPKEEEPKGVKPQRKKRKKRRGETDQEETDEIEDNFASEDDNEEIEETGEPEKKAEDAKRPEKQSFFHALVFGKKEKTPEETKPKDDKSKPKKTKESVLPEKTKQDKTPERETEKPKQIEPTKDVKPKDSPREEPAKAPTAQVKKPETREQVPKADPKKYGDTLTFLEFEKSRLEEQKPKEDISREDKTMVDTRKQPEQKGKDKKGKPVEEKEAPTDMKTTEIIRQPSKEDLKKKGRKTKPQDDKTKPVEVVESAPKTVVTETVELLKQEKVSGGKEKVTLTEDPTKRSTPERDRPTGERITDEPKFPKGVEPVEDKAKVTKKGKTPEQDKAQEEFKPTDKDKKPKEPTKVDKPTVEEPKFEKEDVKKKKDKKEKSPDEDKKKPLDKITTEERKSPQDDRPKLTEKTTTTIKVESKELPEEAGKKPTKKGKPSEKEEPKLADQITQITKFIEGEGRLEEPSKKKTDEKLKPVQKEEPPKKPVEATSEKPKDKKPDVEPEKPREQKTGKSPKDEPSKKDIKDDKKPKEVEEPKKKGKSPEQEEPTKREVKPTEEDKKPKDKVTIVEEIKFQPEEPKKKEKSPEQKEPTKKDVKPAEDKKPKDKVTIIEEIKLQSEEPKKKGKSPDKEEKPKDKTTIIEVTKFMEAEKPLADEKKPMDGDKKPIDKKTIIEEVKFEPGKPKEPKKEKTPEEPTRKDEKPVEDGKKPKEKRSFFDIITKPFTKGQSPTDDKSVDPNKQAKDKPKELEEPSKKDSKPTSEDKTPKGIVVEKVQPEEPKKKEKSPEHKEPTKKDVRPAEEDKKPKDKVTVIEEFKFQPGKPKEIDEPKKKGKSPEQEEPTKKDVKPTEEDKKSKGRVTVVEEVKFQPEEPKKKGISPDKEEKPKDRITITEVTKFIETEKTLENERTPRDKRTVTRITEIVEPKKVEKPVDDEKKPKEKIPTVEEMKFQPEEPKKKEKSPEQKEPTKKDVKPTKDKKPKDRVTVLEETKFQPEESKKKEKSPEQKEPTKKDAKPTEEDKKPKDKVTVTEEVKFQPEEPKKKEKSPEQKEPTKKDVKPTGEDKKPKDRVTVVEEMKFQPEEPKKKGKSPDKEEKPKDKTTIIEVTKFMEAEKPSEDERTPRDKRTVTKITEISEPKKDKKPVDDEKKPKEKVSTVEEIKFQQEKPKKKGKSPDEEEKPKDRVTITEVTKFIETEKPLEDGKKPEGKRTVTKITEIVEAKKDEKPVDDEKKPKGKKPVNEDKFEPDKPKEIEKGKPSDQEPSGKDKPLVEDKKPKDKKSFTEITEIREPEKPKEGKGKPGEKDRKPTEDDKKPKDKRTVVERIEFQTDESKKKDKYPSYDINKVAEPEKPKDDSTKAKKPVGKEDTLNKDKKPSEDEKEENYKTTIVEITKFIETEKPKETEPSKKPDKPDESSKEPKMKEKAPEGVKIEPEKPKEREESSDKDRKPKDEDKKPKGKQTIVEEIKFEPEEPKEKKGKAPEQEEPSKEDEDKQKPKDKVTVIEELKFQPGKPKEIEEPKKKGKSPEQEEPTKKDVKPTEEDKKPKDRVTVVEEVKLQSGEPKKGKSPEQEDPSKKAKKPEDDKKPKDKTTTVEEIKFQPEKPKATEEPQKKGKFPEKDSTKKEEKPKDVTTVDVSKITEPEKPKEDSTKKEKPPQKEEPSKKDLIPSHDEKKPKDRKTVTTTFEITKFIEAEKPESVQPSKKVDKPLDDITKKPKDKTTEDVTVDPGKPKEQKKEMEPQPSGKDGKPVEDEKKLKGKKTFAEITEIKEPERPKEKSPETKQPSKKDDKPVEDKKPKDKKTLVEITKTTESEKPKEYKKEKSPEEPTMKEVKPTEGDKKPTGRITFVEEIKFQPEDPKGKGKSPEQEEPTKKEVTPTEDKKPKDKVTVIEEFKFQPGKPKAIDEPKKKGKSPEQEEPTKKDFKPSEEDKKPKGGITVVEEIKFQPEESKKKEKSPEQKEPTKKDAKPTEEDKKPKDKVTVTEEIKFQPEEPKKKGKSPQKEEKPKGESTIIEVTKFIETEKTLKEERTPRDTRTVTKIIEIVEPKKDEKPTVDDKKPKEKISTVEEITSQPEKPKKKEKSPEQKEPTKKDVKPPEEDKKPKDRITVVEEMKFQPEEPKKKGKAPDKEEKPKDKTTIIEVTKFMEAEKPLEDERTPKDRRTVTRITEIVEPKKDEKPIVDDKKPKEKISTVEGIKYQPEEPKKKEKSPEQKEPTKKDVKSTEEDKKPKDKVTVVEEMKFQPEEPKKKGKAPDKEEKPKDKTTIIEVTKFMEAEKPLEDERTPRDRRPVTRITEVVEPKKVEKTVDDEKKPKDKITTVEEIKSQSEEPKRKEKSPEEKEPTKKDIKPTEEDKKPKGKVTVVEEIKFQAEEPKKKEEKPKGRVTITEVTKFIETEKPLEDEKKPKDKKTFVEITKTTEPEKPKDDSTRTTKPSGKEEPFKKPEDDKKPKDKTTVVAEVRFESGKPKEQKKEKTPEEKPTRKDDKPVEDDKKPKDKKSFVEIITEPGKPTEVAQKGKSADKEKPSKETKTFEIVERVEPEKSVKDRKPGKEKTPEADKPKSTIVEVDTIKLIESERRGKERREPIGEEKAPKEGKPTTEIIELTEDEKPKEKDKTKPGDIKILETTTLLEHEKPREDPAKDKPKDRTVTLVQTKEFTRREGTPAEDLPGLKDQTTIQEITKFGKPSDDAQKKPKDKKPAEPLKDKPAIKEPKEAPKLPGDEKVKSQDKPADEPLIAQDQTKPDKPKDDHSTAIEKPKPKERTKVPEQKPKDQALSQPTAEITGHKPSDKKFSETVTFLEFEKEEPEKRKHPDKTVIVELEPERTPGDRTVVTVLDGKSKVPEPSDKQPSKPFDEKLQKSKKDKPADEKDEPKQKIPAKDKPLFDGTRREPTPEVDKVKPTIQKMTDTRYLIEHEKSPGREVPTIKEKPVDEPKRKTPEKVTVIETTELLESEKTGKEPKHEKTKEILTQKEQPEGITIRQPVQPATKPEKEGKKKSPEEDSVKPVDKAKKERSDEPQKAKTPDKETKPMTTLDQKPVKELAKEEKLPEDPTKKAKSPEKEKPTDKTISDTTKLIFHERVPTKPTEDPTKKETPTDKPVKDDKPKEPSKLEEKEKPKHEKHGTDTVLPDEKSKTKTDEKPRPETRREEPEDMKKKKDRKKPEKGKEEPETPVGKKPEDGKAIPDTEKPEDREPSKAGKEGDQPRDAGVEVTIKHEKTGKKPREDEERGRTQKVEVILEDRKPEDIRLREVLVGKIEKPEEPKDTFASIVGRGKGVRRTPEKHIDVFITGEKSPERETPEDVEKVKKSIDVRFIEKETTAEDTKVPKERKAKEKESEVGEVTKKEDQPSDGSGLTGTLVSMAKSFFGFGGKKPEEKKPDESKPSEGEKKRRRRRVKKKGEEEDEEDEEELEEPGVDIPTKPRRRRRRARKPGHKDGEEEYDEDEEEGEEDEEDEETEEDFEAIPEDASPEKPARRRRSKKKGTVGEEGEEEEDKDVEKLPEAVPQKPGRKRKSKKKGHPGDEEEEEEEEDVEQQKPVTDATLGWSVPAEEPGVPESGRTILFRYDPSDPKFQKPTDQEPQHGVTALVEPKRKSDAKVPGKAPEDTTDEPFKPSAPTFADLFTQTSPQTSPRAPDRSHKISQTKESETTEEGIQTETDKVDQQNQTDRRRPSREAPDGRKTTEKSQQTSKPGTPSFQSIGTSPQVFSPEDSSTESEKPTERKPVDKKVKKPKAEDDVDERKVVESRPVTKPGDKDESFDVHVTAKVSVSQPDVPARSKKDKKERKKWKDEPYEEEPEDVEVSSSISVQTPRDFIETERLNIDLKPTPETEISINVKPKEKFVTEFLDSERKSTKEEPDDFEGRKGKKGKKARGRGDSFRRKESGMPSRDSSPSSDETPGDKDGKYGIGIDIQVGDKPDAIKRKPEDEDGYKLAVDVKVKSGDTPRSPEDTGRAEIGTNFPSPRETDEQDPRYLVVYLQKSSDSGKNRVKKIQNMRNNPRSMTFMIPTYQSLPEEDIKKNVKDIENDIANLKDAVDRKDYVVIRRIFVYLIKNIDDWLETVEYRIILNRQNSNEGPNREKVKELKSLKEEIGGVKQNVADLLKNVKKAPASDDSDVLYQLRTYVEQLEPQINEIQNMTETEQETEAKNLSRWEEFLNGVNNLSVLVEETRQNADRLIDSDRSTDCKLQELEQIEAANREYADRAVNLINLAKDLANEFPNQEIPPETYTTFETTKIVQNNLNNERERLLQLLSLADEYEQTLKEFAQIVEVADNLVESPITITSLEHLQDEMQKHRKFFVNLSHCRVILESLESNLDGETRGMHNHLHGKLHAKASSILDKAASRAQQMAMAASRWTVLDKGARNEQQWLQVAHQRLPGLQQVMSSDYDQYISLYQSLASDAAVHHAKILQLMDVANKLQDVITCVGLEKFHDDYLNVILKLQEEIQSSLEKLLAFQTMWTLYEILTNKLDNWMTTAEEDLKNLKVAPGRASMRQFWELKAQYEVHNRLRQEMGDSFEKAMQFLPITDEMAQRQLLGKLQNRWKKLENEIKEIQDSATASLSAQDVPVNEKLKLLEEELNELNDTVDDLHGVIKTDEELNLYIERIQVLSDRLDTIQEELGRLGLLPAAESEKVGYLLGLGRRLEQQLLEELQESVLLREKLLALQKGLDRVKRNQNSVSSLLDQCGVAETMGSDMVQQAVTACENISADLSDQWQDLMNLRQVLHTLPMRLRLTVSPIKVEREISQLQEVHTVLEERCRNLLHMLGNRLNMWRRFEKQLEKVQQNVQETDYMVELLTLQGSMDLDRLQTATDRLKDLRDSVTEREELVKELKRLAEPLANTCNPEVASQLNAQVDEAVTAWNGSRKNLYKIVDKYNDAVKLWKTYREARDDIRRWIDQQWNTLDLIQDKPEEAVQQIKEFKETLATQKARLDELKKLVAQIAADIGLDPGGLLECEVEDLGKRLEDVKETLTTLTSVAESRTQGKDVCKDELVKAKTFLNSVQKSLNVVGEDGNENRLSTLRDHLLALGKTESQVQNVKEKSIKMNEKPHEIKSETSVVEILELWQQVFRETFQQYYRLSSKLVRSQDGAAALQLWQEYLRHVQTFLAGSLPEDYDGLRETQRLCEVHQNLLTSQQSVLSSRKDDPAIRDFSQALQEQFNSLANLHNETLARIMDRHNEVNKRLKMWDSYRLDQSKLLSWLRDMTRDQSRLQLRYIHLRRLPKLLEQIDSLLSKIPQGKGLIREQQKQQEDIVKFCDEALATSIKMETVATAERINNLEASLKSWKDFLNRVKDLHKNYETELEKVEKVCDEVTNELASPAPVSFSAIQSRLDLCRDLRNRISKYAKNIEEANVTYDQLKECLSPHDMKMLSQRLWLMGQRQGDLEHHLLLQILWLEDRLETQQAFNQRHARFMNWANDLIKRFDKHSPMDSTTKFMDLETRAKRLESEVQIELNLKNREYNALHAMANNIIDLSKEDGQDKDKVMPPGQNRIDYEIMKSDVERKIKEVEDAWEQLKNLKCVRLERKSKLLGTMNDLWKRMEDLKLWLISIEEKLEAPSVIEKSTKKCVDKLLKDHEAIQEEIEKQSGNVGEVLNLCELFLADPAVDLTGIDTNEFESAMKALEKRWKAACLASSERKGRILGAWELLLQLSKICKEQEKWIAEREKALQALSSQSDSPKLNEVQKLLGQLEKEKRELDSKAPALKILDASYSKLAQESRLPAENIQQLAGPAKTLIAMWHSLYGKLKIISDKLARINKLRDDFIRNQNSSIVLLTNISAKLMQAELLSNPKKRLKEVNKLEKELERESGCLKAADETGLELMKTCPEPQNVSATQKMIDEYQVMWKELQKRFADIKNKSLENLESKEIQVSTLAFEADSEVQVDTLPHMDRLTSRDAYGLELDVALRECGQNLKGLESILKASEGEPGATVPTHKTLAKIIATCTSSVELVQHLNQTLVDDCGMNDIQARTAQVKEVTAKFQELVALAREREKQLREASERGRLTCPICSRRNWQQLENDLWRLEQWILYAEAVQSNRPSLPASIEALEDVIQNHRELLIELDSHKSIIVSLNIVGDHLADHVEDEEKARSLRERLRDLNQRWDNVCSKAAEWQGKLQEALIENPEFHDTISDLVKRLENTEAVIRSSEPVDFAQDRVILESQYKKFKALSRELERYEPRVQSLQESAVQLLDRGGSAREKLNALRLRLTGLRRLIKVYLLRLGAVLGSESVEALDQTLMTLSQEMLNGTDSMSQAQTSSTAHTDGEGDTEMGNIRRGFKYLGRVFRASLPIQALMLLLLGAAALVPDEYYSCAFSNNARFQSYYPNGPPPI